MAANPSGVSARIASVLVFLAKGLKSSGLNGEGFFFLSRLAFANMANTDDVCVQLCFTLASAIQNNSRTVKGQGSTPTIPASS